MSAGTCFELKTPAIAAACRRPAPHTICNAHVPTTLQRSEVAIDCCKLGEGHSTFLQQAAHLTGGVYLQPTRPAALLQYLLVS